MYFAVAAATPGKKPILNMAILVTHTLAATDWLTETLRAPSVTGV
jgi:hypothetical protein